MSYKSAKNTKGFTIVELLLYMAIFSLLLVFFVDIFSSVIRLQIENEAVSSVQRDGRYILTKFLYDIHSAQSMTVPAAVGQTTPTLTIAINGTSHTYSLVNGKLEVVNNFGANILNSYDTTLSNLSFFRVGNGGGKDTVTITYTLSSVARQKKGSETKTFQATMGIR